LDTRRFRGCITCIQVAVAGTLAAGVDDSRIIMLDATTLDVIASYSAGGDGGAQGRQTPCSVNDIAMVFALPQ
jgi:hypothetical protein